MLKIERQVKILKILEDQGFISNEDLMAKFNVSMVTIRRDLKSLVEKNLVKLEHGGSMHVDYLLNGIEPQYNAKVLINRDGKREIAIEAVKIIEERDVIILDSGTTTAEIAKNIRKTRFKDLTIITNDLIVAKELCPDSNLQVLMLGGLLRSSHFNSYGHYTEMILESLKADKYFLGVDAISGKRGIFNLVINEVPIKKRMISISNRVIMVSDHTKFDREAPYKVCDLREIDTIISDKNPSKEYIDFFKSLDINLILPNNASMKD